MAKKKKQSPNPWAVCRAMQNEHGWSEAKTERCIKEVKGKRKHKRKKSKRKHK